MADKITWLLGADASEVRAEMNSAVASAKTGTDQMAGSFGKVEGAHGKLLRSGRAVSGQIANISRDLLSGASAGQVFATSLEGIGRSLNLSLGALAGLAVGVAAVQAISQLREEYRKLAEDLAKFHAEASKSGDFQTMSQLEAAAGKAEEAIKKLQKRISDRSGETGVTGGVWQQFKDYLVGGRVGATLIEGSDKTALRGAYSDQDKNEADRIGKRRQLSDIREGALAGEPDYAGKAKKLQIDSDEKAANSLDELAQVTEELNLAFRELSKSVTDKHLERSGMTLKELAATPATTMSSDGISYERWKAGEDARRAISLDAASESARINFDPVGANAGFNAAGAVKEGITNLKPSEQMSADFKGALVITEAQLKVIATNTAQPLVNR